MDTVNGGQWVEAISRKKSRKLKEEAAKSEAKKKSSASDTVKTNSQGNGVNTSPQKNKSKSIDSKTSVSNKSDSLSRKQTSKDNSNIVNSDGKSEELKSVKMTKKTREGPIANKTNIDDSDQYHSKDQRTPKKVEKEQKARNRRNSENKKNGPTSGVINEGKDNTSAKASDKITAAILANYQNSANQVDNKSKKKPQQTNPNSKNNQVNEKKSEDKAKDKSSVSSTNTSSAKPEHNGLTSVADGKRLSASKAELTEPAVTNGDVNGNQLLFNNHVQEN